MMISTNSMSRLLFAMAALPATMLEPAPLCADRPLQIIATTAKSVETKKGFFRQYAIGDPGSGPAIVAVDEDNAVWTALARSGQLVRLENGRFTFFEIGKESRPVGLVPDTAANGRKGVVWIAAAFDDKIVRFDSLTRKKEFIELPGGSWPFMAAMGPDGDIWFTQRASNRLGRIDGTTLELTNFPLPNKGAGPAGLAVHPRTGEVWFSQSTADRIGRFDPKSGKFASYPMGDQSTGMTSGPAGLAISPNGHIWFTKLEGKIGHLVPDSDTIELIDVPELARRPAGITTDRNGDVWVLALDGNLVLRYRPSSRSFVAYPMPTGSIDLTPATPPNARTSRPFGLAFDHTGDLWITEQYTGQLTALDLQPPQVQLISPGPETTLADPLLTFRALDGVAGVKEVLVTVDGAPAETSHGRLILRSLVPGRHELAITVTDHAGHAAATKQEFDYNPGPAALAGIVAALTSKNTEAELWKARAVAQLTSAGIKSDDLLRLKAEFEAIAPRFLQASPIAQAFEFAARQAGQHVVVRLLDGAPFFSSTEIRIRKGGSVTWTYDSRQPHGMPSAPRRLQITGAATTSSILRPGEAFTYRFNEAGTYTISDIQAPERSASIKVWSPKD